MVDINERGTYANVTFRLPRADGAQQAWVVGEFNDWSTTTNPMEPDGDVFICRMRVQAGRSYRFRYLVDGHRWENDWDADAYIPNEFGGDDSVIDLTEPRPTGPESDAASDAGAQTDGNDKEEARMPPQAWSDKRGRTREQLYNEAREKGIKGRSKMTKAELERAVDR
jgi:hypothetical protein